MAHADVRKLKDEAAEAVDRGKFKRALECYSELERLDARDANWPRRAGDAWRKLDDDDAAVAAYLRAADAYVQAGFVIQAIAMCKLALQLRPEHELAVRRLTTLDGKAADRRGKDAIAAASQALAGTGAGGRMAAGSGTTAHFGGGAKAAGAGADISIPLDLGLDEGSFEIERSAAGPGAAGGAKAAAASTSARAVHARAIEELDLAEAVPGGARIESGPGAGMVEIPLDDADVVLEMESDAFAAGASAASGVGGGDVAEVDDDEDTDTIDLDAEFEDADTETMTPESEPTTSSRASYAAMASVGAAPVVAPVAATAALRAVPLFGALDAQSLARLALGVALIDAGPGETLMREGDPGDTMFVVADGQVAIVSEGPPRLELARLGPGEFFGEVALLADVARSATVVATEPTQLLAMSRELMMQLIAAEPAVLPVLLRFLRSRLLDRLLQTNPIFNAFEAGDRDALVAKFRFFEVPEGTELITEGTLATGLHVVMAGRAEVLRDGNAIATLKTGDVFGEMSLLSSDVAGATVQTTSKTLLLHLPVETFRQLILTHPQVLMYLSELADKRKAAGSTQYEDIGHFDVF